MVDHRSLLRRFTRARTLVVSGVACMLLLACSTQSTAPSELTGQACKTSSDCYAGVDAGSLRGTTVCMDRVPGGYCTHTCESDGDCCAVTGECRTGIKQVCAPFESTGQKYCFLSCEKSEVEKWIDAGATDEATYCKAYANTSFGCRSTGGGSENRKVCVP